MSEYLFRVVDRGPVNGVPVADGYLLRADGPAEACVLHTAGLGLSPASVEVVAAALGELGVRVERVARPADPAATAPAPARPRKRRAKAAAGTDAA